MCQAGLRGQRGGWVVEQASEESGRAGEAGENPFRSLQRDRGRPRDQLHRRWVMRRVGPYLVTVFVLITLNFLLPRLMPGDPITTMLSRSSEVAPLDDETRRSLEDYYGIDRPLHAQYADYLTGLVRGDLGVSIRHRVPVATLVAERLPWTLLLASTATVLALAVGLVAGVSSGWRRGRPVDRGLLVAFSVVQNAPPFFVASMALLVFAVTLGWAPLAGATTPFSNLTGLPRLLDIVHHLVLPAAVMALQFSAGYYLVMRAGMVSELGADHLLLGRAKGLGERRLKYRYAARNALLPAVSLGALQLAFALTGAIFVETVFAYPGLGRLAFDAIDSRDYPAIQGSLLVFTLAMVGANLLADGLSRRLDPRTAL